MRSPELKAIIDLLAKFNSLKFLELQQDYENKEAELKVSPNGHLLAFKLSCKSHILLQLSDKKCCHKMKNLSNKRDGKNLRSFFTQRTASPKMKEIFIFKSQLRFLSSNSQLLVQAVDVSKVL